MNVSPYPKYKQSGAPWIGDVPAHWKIQPTFGAFEPNHERNDGMKEKTVLSLSYGRIVIKPAEKLHGLVPESFETYQIVNPGDIVLRTTDLQNDHTSLRVGLVREGYTCPQMVQPDRCPVQCGGRRPPATPVRPLPPTGPVPIARGILATRRT